MSSNGKHVINHYLGDEITSINDIIADKQDIKGLLTNAFYSGMTGWLMLSNVLIVLFTILLFWSGFKFFMAEDTNGYIYWGICLVVSLQIQIALKQWLWTQLDRNSIVRELKRTQRMLLGIDGNT